MTIGNIPIPAELNYKFNRIKFHDDIHKYYLGDRNLISVTTLLHKFQEPFDEAHWSEIKARDYDISQQEVIDLWDAWNVKSTAKGSAVHNYAELKFNNKVYAYDQDIIDKKLGAKNIDILKNGPIKYADKVASGVMEKMEGYTIKEEYEIVRGYVDNFYNDTFNKLIPIKTEYIVFDELWGLAGMMDIIFWNVKKQCFQIWDWKTNKDFTHVNKYNQRLKYPLFKLDDTHMNMYSLQLSAYKTIITRNCDIKIDGMYVVWLNEVNDNYKIFECHDYSDYIPRLVENISI
jgi:hypothetical protein